MENKIDYLNDVPELDSVHQEKVLMAERARIYLDDLVPKRILRLGGVGRCWKVVVPLQDAKQYESSLSELCVIGLEYGEYNHGEWWSTWGLILTDDGWVFQEGSIAWAHKQSTLFKKSKPFRSLNEIINPEIINIMKNV